MSEETRDEAADSATSRRSLLQLAALAGLPLAASDVGSAATGDHLGETWSDGDGLTIEFGGSLAGLLVESDNYSLRGHTNTDWGRIGTGVYGVGESAFDIGVEGVTKHESTENYGVKGTTYSSSGYGVYGENASDSGGYGVYSDGDMHVEGDFTASGTKNFVQTVDTADGEKQVAYTAVEADQAQTETTGVAELDDGRAEIDLPEHFGMVTSDDEDLVVQLTPYEIDVPGLAVTERTTDSIVVESRDGTGDFEFSYTVRGVREGYEDTAVVSDSE